MEAARPLPQAGASPGPVSAGPRRSLPPLRPAWVRVQGYLVSATAHAIALMLLSLAAAVVLDRRPPEPAVRVRLVPPPAPAAEPAPEPLPALDPAIVVTTIPEPKKGRDPSLAPPRPDPDPGDEDESRRPRAGPEERPHRPEEPTPVVGLGPLRPPEGERDPATRFPDRKAWEEYWRARLPDNIDALRLPVAWPEYEGLAHQQAVARFFGEREAILIPRGEGFTTVLVDAWEPLAFHPAPPDFNPGYRDYARGAIHRRGTPFDERYGPALELVAGVYGVDLPRLRDRYWFGLMPPLEFGYHARKVLDALAAAGRRPDDPEVAAVRIAYPKTAAGYAEVVTGIVKQDGTVIPVKDREAP